MEVTASPLLDAVVDRGAPHAVYTSVAALRTMHQRAPPLPRACRSRLSFPATSHTVPLCTCIPHDLVFTLTPQPSLRARHSSPDCRREHPGLYRTLLVNRTDARVPSVPPRRVPLRARHIPTTTSGQLPPGLLRPRPRTTSRTAHPNHHQRPAPPWAAPTSTAPAERWPRPGRSQRGSRCVLRPALLVLAHAGAAGHVREGVRGERW